MQKQKSNWKPVKVLAVIFMAGLFLVLIPKFGTEAKAAEEITSNTGNWSGEMTLTSGNVKIENGVRLLADATLRVATGCVLTVEHSIFCNGHTLTIDGEGKIDVKGYTDPGIPDAVAGINGDIVLINGEVNVTGGDDWNYFGGAAGVLGNVIINGGIMTATGGKGDNQYKAGNGIEGNITVNGGQLSAIGGNGLHIGGDGIYGENTNSINIIVNGGKLIASGGDYIGVSNDGVGGGYGVDGLYIYIYINGGTMTVRGGNIEGNATVFCGDGLGMGEVTLNGGTLNAAGGNGTTYPGWAFMGMGADFKVTGGYQYAVDGEGSYTGILNENQIWGGPPRSTFLAPIYTVDVTNGSNMTKTTDSGAASQSRVIGAMTPVVYNADDGYYFPENYSVDPVYGVGVTRNSYTQITVSGTPATSASITLSAATAQTKQEKPQVRFSATGADKGTLYDLINGAEYVLSGAVTTSFVASGTSLDIENVSAGTLSVVRKGNGADKRNSDAQSITIEKATTPNSITATACSTASNDNGKLSGITTAMEYRKSDCADWTTGTGETVTGLTNGIYYVRVKAAGTMLASEYQTLTIEEYSASANPDNTSGNSESTSADSTSAVVTPVYNQEPVSEKEEPKPSVFTRKNKDGSVTTITIVWNADGTTTVINENKQADGTTLVKEETRDAKGNGTIKIEKKDADGNLLSSTEGTIGVNKKSTETIKSTTKNADGSVSEKTQKTYKRDPNADNIKKVTITEKKTDAEGNTETIKTTALVGVLGDATITEKSTYNGVGADGKTAVTVKEERQYSLSVNGRLKLTSLSTDGEKLTIPESIELDGMTRVVKAIGKNAMKGNKTVKEVVIGENITTICTGAFKNCKNLELIELTGSVKKIYKNAFKGIAENAKFVIKASEEDFERIVELLKKSGVSDTVTFERMEA